MVLHFVFKGWNMPNSGTWMATKCTMTIKLANSCNIWSIFILIYLQENACYIDHKILEWGCFRPLRLEVDKEGSLGG